MLSRGAAQQTDAMRRSRYCYYHDSATRRRTHIKRAAMVRERMRVAPPTAAMLQEIALDPIESPAALQHALDSIIQSLWSGLLDGVTASAMLQAIRMKQRGPLDPMYM